jgi:hypothetical protein
MKKTILIFSILLLLSVSFVLAEYGNPRLGNGILETEEVNPQIIELAKCYSSLNKIQQEITFAEYYFGFNKNGLSEECEEELDNLMDKKLWYQEVEDSFVDSDEDQFTDLEEKNEGTDLNNDEDFPWWIDFDGDGYNNDYEIIMGSDPLDDYNTPDWEDYDKDGFSDEFELIYNSNPQSSEDFPTIPSVDLIADEELVSEEVNKKKGWNWQIYLAIVLGVLLIIILMVYFIYYNKEK